MKLYFYSFLLAHAFSLTLVCAQNKPLPNGVYLTIDAFKNKQVSYPVNLSVLNNDEGYILKSTIDSIGKKYLQREVFVYVKNDSVFINCHKHNLRTGYSLALTSGAFIVFKSSSKDEKTKLVPMPMSPMGGGGIGIKFGHKTTGLRVLSLRTGNVKLLTKEYLKERLKEYPILLSAFDTEVDKDGEQTLIKYINLLNEKRTTTQ
jgi:hypothetical protein